ncbi:MAG: galactokinase [Candidatus Choladocola sp.]|nr:galactokinase [Candidatus Choladocola sp.]
MKLEEIRQCFVEKFGGEGDIRSYFAPGRVNLIGEHTDYNGGHVFPCALTIGTYMFARKREDNKLRFYSMNFEKTGVVESSLEKIAPKSEKNWTAYPKGMMWAFNQKGFPIDKGVDMVLFGNIPNGSGLSSSASVELVTGVMLRDMFGYDSLTNTDLALYGQYSENNYNGVNCGIMDQFAIAMGKKDQAIFLDTSDLSYQYAPIALENARIVIASSNKKRGLGDSKYNERRSECETALAEIQKVKDVPSLGALTIEEFEAVKDAIQDPVRVRRARHAVYENQRTVQAVEALKKNDIEQFGRLMNESHVSLRDDYEVTGIELDTLAEEAWKCEGVIGSRMTGAGFGGCTVSIVKNEAVDSFIEKVGAAYKKKIGYAADFYVVDIGDGAGVLA